MDLAFEMRMGTKMRGDLTRLEGNRYDVVVVGAGINGASTAARLARSGYKSLLIDKGDIGGGSSSRSSRLLHCGLNYLASAKEATTLSDRLQHLRSAKEMMRYRTASQQEIPNRIRKHTFYIPVLRDDPIQKWQFDLAFLSLFLLSGFKEGVEYRNYKNGQADAPQMLEYFGNNLMSAASFVDIVYDWPERICVDMALDAGASGADIRNYTSLANGQATARGWELSLVDTFEPQKTAAVSARLLLNLAGVWSDAVAAKVDVAGEPTVTPNKGCHIAVRLPSAFSGKGIIRRNSLGHLFICVPWRGLHIIGPTETPYSGSLDDITPDDSDVALLLEQANATVPGLHLTADDIVFRWAGLRPAAFQEGSPRGTWMRVFHDLSPRPEAPMLSMAWGRIADHADTAERIARLVQAKLGAPTRRHKVSCLRPRACSSFDDIDLAEVIETEQAMTVADVLFRRTGQGWDADLGLPYVERVAQALEIKTGRKRAPELIDEYFNLLRRSFGYRDVSPLNSR